MLNAVNVNLIGFAVFTDPEKSLGQIIAIVRQHRGRGGGGPGPGHSPAAVPPALLRQRG